MLASRVPHHSLMLGARLAWGLGVAHRGEHAAGGALQAIDRLRSAADNVKWVAPENLHWTLQFLGDITDEEMAAVCRVAGKVAARHDAFPLTAAGVGAFPKPERPERYVNPLCAKMRESFRLEPVEKETVTGRSSILKSVAASIRPLV